LEDRWALWGPPPEAPFTEGVSRRLHVTKAELRTVTTRLPPHPATAAEGTVEWTCSDPGAATTVERLLRFAEYAGVGSRTEHGLGVVRVSGQVPKP
jgi:CRISPR/Cas system endoribonuclease Cas6 (RAMP superfamily)